MNAHIVSYFRIYTNFQKDFSFCSFGKNMENYLYFLSICKHLNNIFILYRYLYIRTTNTEKYGRSTGEKSTSLQIVEICYYCRIINPNFCKNNCIKQVHINTCIFVIVVYSFRWIFFFFFFKRSPDNIHNHFLSVLFQYSILLTLLISLNSFALCSMLQIRLWESDMNRVDMTPSYFYDEFPSKVKQLFIRLIAFHFFVIYYVYLFIFLGGLWRCLRLCTRIWWFTMGGFKEDAFACKGRNTHANERTFTPSKVENSTFGFPYTKVFFYIYIYICTKGEQRKEKVYVCRERRRIQAIIQSLMVISDFCWSWFCTQILLWNSN